MSTDKPKITRVVIVDDSRASQAILEAAFEGRRDYKVVGIGADAVDGEALIRRLAPDLVTLDLCMPYIDGASMLELTANMPAVCKVIVSDQAASSIMMSSKLEALGAAACLSKRELTDDPLGFFKKLHKACERVEAAAILCQAGPLALSSDPSSRPGARPPSGPAHFGFPVPADEELRLRALQTKQLANAVRERHFDRITRFTAESTGFPVCLLTFIDHDTQWIKSSFGFEGQSTPRAHAFCNYTIANGSMFVVTNAATDTRFSTNPYVVGSPGLRTYAGHPIVSAAGVRMGALCILDTKVRPITLPVARTLSAVADIIGGIIDGRPALAA